MKKLILALSFVQKSNNPASSLLVMELNALIQALKIGGPVALGMIILFFLLKEIIRKSIFPKLTKGQAYTILLSVLFILWSVVILLIFRNDRRDDKAQGRYKIRYEVRLVDSATKNPLQGAIAYILNQKKGDTLIKSAPSGDNGQVFFDIDTTEKSITAVVHFWHPRYKNNSRGRELPALNEPDLILAPLQIVQSRFFSIKNFALSPENIEVIEMETSCRFSSTGEGTKFEANHSTPVFKPTPGTDNRFRHGVISVNFLCNGNNVLALSRIPESSSNGRTREDLEQEIAGKFSSIVASKNEEIVQKIIECLNR